MRLLRETSHDGSVEPEGLARHMGFGYTELPVYRGVEKVPPAGHVLVSRDGARQRVYWEAPGSSQAEVDHLASVLTDAAPREGLLGATAGKDSLCLAAAMAAGPPRWTGTFGAPGCADQAQGQEVAQRLGSAHRTWGVCSPEDFPCWSSHVAYHSAGLATASYADMAAFVARVVPPRTPFVMGEGGECVRQFFGPDPAARLTQQYMTPLEYLEATLSAPPAGYPQRMLGAVRESLGAADDETFAVRFYRNRRMSGNFSLRQAVLAPLSPKVSPFLDSRFLDGACGLGREWSADSRLHRALIERLAPQFLDLFDAPAKSDTTVQDWEARFAGGIGEQAARMLEDALPECGDVLRADGVRRLCEQTILRPSRAVYHLLRVLSFARGRQILRGAASRALAGGGL